MKELLKDYTTSTLPHGSRSGETAQRHLGAVMQEVATDAEAAFDTSVVDLSPMVRKERLLALLTGVLYAHLLCFRLFLKFCMGKMAECMEFQDYLQAGVPDSVREGTPAASWAKAKMRLTKSLRHLGDSRSQWLQTFASASGFGGTEEALIENLIGYTLTEQVQINMTTRAFDKVRVFTSGLSTAGARLKKVMRRRFKMIDGVEYFEVHKGEWVRSDSAPVGPCKTCKGHGLIERHWVWNCARLE